MFCYLNVKLKTKKKKKKKKNKQIDRMIASFLTQTWFQFLRASRQYVRDVFGVALDLFLPLFTGMATGVLVKSMFFFFFFFFFFFSMFFSFIKKSIGKQWTPPLTEISDWAANATRCLGCAQQLADTPVKIEAVCKVIIFLFFCFIF